MRRDARAFDAVLDLAEQNGPGLLLTFGDDGETLL